MAEINIFASVMYYKILTAKELSIEDFWPLLAPNLSAQLLFLDFILKLLGFWTLFVQQLFRDSFSFSSYSQKKYLGANPSTP